MDKDIFDLAMAKKLFGGGGGKREGTAIDPAGDAIAIYLNTKNTREETDALLSQLPYVQTDLLANPIYPILATPGFSGMGQPPVLLFALKAANGDDASYAICACQDITSGKVSTLYATDGNEVTNGWAAGEYISYSSNLSFPCVPSAIGVYGDGITEIAGLPVGTENEKIKNVLSITPF